MARFPTYTFSPEAARYRSLRSGRFASSTAIRNALFQAADAEMQRAKRISEQVRRGEMSVAEWRLQMREIVKLTQLYGEAGARGGWVQMDAASIAQVEQRVRVQYAFLDGFAAELEQGKPMSVDRAAQYVKASKSAYTETRAQVVRVAGFDEIKSVTHPAEHCEQCLFEEARGFVKIGTEVPLGSRTCLHNERCTAVFRNSQTGEEQAA